MNLTVFGATAASAAKSSLRHSTPATTSAPTSATPPSSTSPTQPHGDHGRAHRPPSGPARRGSRAYRELLAMSHLVTEGPPQLDDRALCPRHRRRPHRDCSRRLPRPRPHPRQHHPRRHRRLPARPDHRHPLSPRRARDQQLTRRRTCATRATASHATRLCAPGSLGQPTHCSYRVIARALAGQCTLRDQAVPRARPAWWPAASRASLRCSPSRVAS
jgi:hypothetical protein